jgi:hypothetical protein
MNLLTYLLAKKSFLEQLKEEVNEVISDFAEIIEMLKDLTYGNLEKILGPDVALMLVIGIGAILVMIFCLKIINR